MTRLRLSKNRSTKCFTRFATRSSLVAIVVLLFLQDWKAMILPMIDVPVSLVGTFAVMYLMGFTLNNLTLFGLVLAIGIVVDDAIVVLEAVEIKLAQGLDARTATIQAMGEITGAIIAITLVLCSVFLPSALIGGISGQFYRQFALTIAASMVISAINAMTMTPSRAVLIFKDVKHGGHGHEDTREALPWWGYAALLGWLGASLLERYCAGSVGLEHFDGGATDLEGLAVLVAALGSGGDRRLSGSPARQPNTVAVFQVVQSRLRFRGKDVRQSRRGVVAALGDRAFDLWRIDRADVFRHDAHPDRIHSVAGQRLPDRRRAAARLGVARANGRASTHRGAGAGLRKG